jgi:hypothetical protein
VSSRALLKVKIAKKNCGKKEEIRKVKMVSGTLATGDGFGLFWSVVTKHYKGSAFEHSFRQEHQVNRRLRTL